MNPGSLGLAEVALGDTVSALVGSVQVGTKPWGLDVTISQVSPPALLICTDQTLPL